MTDNNFSSLQVIFAVEASHDSPEQAEQKILPRTAWSKELAYLKAIMKAKRSLDQIEQAHSALKNAR